MENSKNIITGKIFFEGEYMNGKEWNSKVYDKDGNIIYEKKMEKEQELSLVILIIQNLKENIQMV